MPTPRGDTGCRAALRVCGALVRFIACMVVMAIAAAARPAGAQEIITTGPEPYDRARVSGFWWYGEINGTVSSPQLAGLPQFDAGLDITEDLGISGGASGWQISADAGLARRHRLLFAFAGLSQSGASELGSSNLGRYITDTAISMRELRAAYEYLFIAGDWIDAGIIGGVGYFNEKVGLTVSGPVGNVLVVPPLVAQLSRDANSLYPLIGGSVLLDSADDIVAIYGELTGFPSVEVGGQNGWLMNFALDFIVSPSENIAIITGYKRYQHSLDEGAPINVNLVWDGFIFGGRYTF